MGWLAIMQLALRSQTSKLRVVIFRDQIGQLRRLDFYSMASDVTRRRIVQS